MVLRFFAGNRDGTFRFRVSRQGADALTDDLSKLVIHENMQPMVPFVTGDVTVPGRTSTSVLPAEVTVNVGRSYSVPPFVVLKCNLNTLPGITTYCARLNMASGNLTLSNAYVRQAITIKYAIYEPL